MGRTLTYGLHTMKSSMDAVPGTKRSHFIERREIDKMKQYMIGKVALKITICHDGKWQTNYMFQFLTETVITLQ